MTHLETKEEKEGKWTTVIKSRNGLFDINLREIWQYRDLFTMFVKRDIITSYKQTILGPLWFFIQPALTTVMYMVVFGGIAGISTDGLPQALFYLAGILCWQYFADCLNKTSNTFVANQNMFGKVYFPRLVVPLSTVVSNLIRCLLIYIVRGCVCLLSSSRRVVAPNWYFCFFGTHFHVGRHRIRIWYYYIISHNQISRFNCSFYLHCSAVDVRYSGYLPIKYHYQ